MPRRAIASVLGKLCHLMSLGRVDATTRMVTASGISQEFYVVGVASFVIGCVMRGAAQHAQRDPDRLSFVATVHLVVAALPLFQLAPSAAHDRLWRWLMDWIVYFHLPPRQDRINHRVIKKHRAKFPRKRPEHFAVPQPTRPFRDAVVMLT
jgi:hypothetical protein